MAEQTKKIDFKQLHEEAVVELEKERARNDEYKKTNAEVWELAFRLLWQSQRQLKIGATATEIQNRMPTFRKHIGEDVAEALERKWRAG
jgi:hypothetical protein